MADRITDARLDELAALPTIAPLDGALADVAYPAALVSKAELAALIAEVKAARAAPQSDRLISALKRLHREALDMFDVEGEQGAAMEEAHAALAAAGDPDAIAADQEWERLGR